MIDPDKYLEYLERKEIPPQPPYGSSVRGHDFNYDADIWKLRDKARKLGLFPILTTQVINEMADWIGDRTCLEIMAGCGWLSKGLAEKGIKIYATDDCSWEFHSNQDKYVYPVEKLNALNSVKKYKSANVLIVSWPPYEESALNYALDEWGTTKPIIYIGEPEGGCTADDTFFENYILDTSAPKIPLFCYPGTHDVIFIGHWKRLVKGE